MKALLFVLIALVATALGDQCNPDRVAVAKLWVDKLNVSSNALQLRTIMEAIVADNFEFTIKGVGTFTPKVVAIEYSILIFPFLGIQPFSTSIHYFDACAVSCNGDTIDLFHTGDAGFAPDVNGTYTTWIRGLRLFQRLEFQPGTNLIHKAFTQNEKTYYNFLSTKPVNYTLVCGWIQSVCVGDLQQYTSLQDCVDFLTNLSTVVSPCPFPTVSNTVSCRQLHALSALTLPQVHCPHVAKVSPVCRDSCADDCVGSGPHGFCADNAQCSDRFINYTIAHYECICKPGYIGNGYSSCSNSTCSTTNNQNSWQCPGVYSYSNCTGQKCSCADSFTWNGQTTDTCGCLANERLWWTNGVPQCIPYGRCNERWQCPQDWSKVGCVTNNGNPFAKWKDCKCNYGFCGGYESQCACLGGDRKVVWSDTFGGEVCLQDGVECTANWHCNNNNVCQIPQGQQLGTCVSS